LTLRDTFVIRFNVVREGEAKTEILGFEGPLAAPASTIFGSRFSKISNPPPAPLLVEILQASTAPSVFVRGRRAGGTFLGSTACCSTRGFRKERQSRERESRGRHTLTTAAAANGYKIQTTATTRRRRHRAPLSIHIKRFNHQGGTERDKNSCAYLHKG
jgi:hypothetical protein